MRARSRIALLLATLLCIGNILAAQSKSVLKEAWINSATCILKDKDSGEIAALAKKGDGVLILRPAFCFLKEGETVDKYKVRTGDGTTGYIYSKYICFDKKEAMARYMPEKYDSLHLSVKDSFHGGRAFDCDFNHWEKARFEDNVMPEACYSLYITCSPRLLNNIEAYISLAKETAINCFVIDIKEDGAPGYKAEAMKKYAPSAYKRAGDNEALYRHVVKRLQEEGFWVVGRIVTFKDYHFTKDHPECALWDKVADTLLFHNKSNWPSAYSRKVWEYNVALAKESVEKLGFNEINFDYVRFPDRMNSIESRIEMRNRYNESKVQAIQRFVSYAADQLHEIHAYVSIDVFGESANPGYTTAYGQYWPAISNVADVICGMPYPDHFSNGYYGIQKPWNHPHEIMKAWGERVQDRQKATPSPAVVRTWVQAYHVMRHVDRNGIDYDAENIKKEILGLYDADLTGGYTTWLSSCDINRYRMQAGAFKIDYRKDWLSKKAITAN